MPPRLFTNAVWYIRNNIILCFAVILFSLIYFASITIAEQNRVKEMTKKQEAPSWQGDVVTINLSSYFHEEELPNLEFAYDGSPYILAWSWPPMGDYRKGMVKQIVLDLAGKIVKSAYENDGLLTERFIPLFPDTSWRQKWCGFVKDADGWGFSKDWHFGVRLFEKKIGPDHYWKMELCELGMGIKKLWEVSLPETTGVFKLLKFLKFDGKNSILVAFSGNTAHIVSESDGSLIKIISYTPQISYTPYNALNLNFPHFSASYIDYNSKHRLVAYGDSTSRRVRLIKVDDPNDIVAEINVNDSMANLKGGIWRVERVQFYADKYLVIEYRFGGRETQLVFEPTDIYEIDKMKLCWHENSLEINSVALSPDARRLAFMRDMILEIGPFTPQYDP